jgi:penicillin-binding protein 1B
VSGLPRKPTRKTAKTRSRGGAGRPRLRRWLKTAALAVGSAGFVAGFAFAGYVVRLDRSVRERFDGERFRVPSRVYSAPSILYPGLDWKLVDLEGTLLRLGYRKVATTGELESGRYLWSPSRLRVQLRAFDHPSRPEPPHDVVFVLRGSQIEEIRELPAGRELGAVLLEPEPIGAYYGPDREQRELVWLEEVPRHLVDAILAVEDQRFESHHGIDPRRIAGAMLANLRAGRVAQGGSTLTQQLVKNFFLTPERTVRRKVQEGVMALLVEARYDKREILQAYLNEIYFGQRGATAVHGVGEASRLYFGKTAANLGVAESALLAAIIQSPNGKSPYRDPERAVERRNLVLELMHRQGRISEAALQRARQEPLRLAAVTPDSGDARYFLDLLQRQLASSYSSEVLETEGLRIYSTLDRRAQRIAADALREGIESLEKRYSRLRSEDPRRALQGCIVALRPQTGEVIALVGGRDYSVTQFDRCSQARRQTGSVFKPFVYIAALEPRPGGPIATLASFVDDSPLEVRTPSGPWRPVNFDHKFHGPVPLREALERSYNTATARLAQDVGIERVIDVAKRMGISSDLPAVPSLALGTAIVSPLEVARAYATLASGGVRPEVQAAEDLVNEEGEILQRRRLRFERVLDAGTAFLATSLLQGVADHGTAAGLRAGGLRGPIAAKTGTTTSEHDLWLVGYTPELVAVVWLGYDEPRSLGIPSSQGALPIWRRFVQDLTGGEIRGSFRPPPGVETADIDPRSGALASWGCPERRSEYFLAGTLPVLTCPAGGVAGTRREPAEREEVERGFLEWLRRQL